MCLTEVSTSVVGFAPVGFLMIVATVRQSWRRSSSSIALRKSVMLVVAALVLSSAVGGTARA